jgi:hypothetical protein
MYEIAPSLVRYDIVEPATLGAAGLKFVAEANKGSKSTGEPLRNVIKDFYLTDVISRRYLLLCFCANLVPQPWHDVVRRTPNEIQRFSRKLRYINFVKVANSRCRMVEVDREQLH